MRSATVLAPSGVEALEGQKPAHPPRRLRPTCTIRIVARSAFPAVKVCTCALDNRPIGLQAVIRGSVAQGLTPPASVALGLQGTVATGGLHGRFRSHSAVCGGANGPLPERVSGRVRD